MHGIPSYLDHVKIVWNLASWPGNWSGNIITARRALASACICSSSRQLCTVTVGSHRTGTDSDNRIQSLAKEE